MKKIIKNNLFKAVSVLSAATMLVVAGAANAASIVMTPNPATGNVGDPILVDIEGIGWVAGESGTDAGGNPALTSSGSSGGGLIVTWDNTVVNLAGGLTGLNLTFPGSQDFPFDPGTPTLTILPGDIAELRFDVTSFATTTFLEDFPIAELSFEAVSPGQTTTTLTLATFALWLDGDFNVERDVIDLSPTTIEVSSVPVPPAVWLFGSGLLGLVGVARRRSTGASV